MRESVENYYGTVLQSTSDLKTSACTTACVPTPRLSSYLAKIHPEVLDTFYGCGLVYPPVLEGARVLDLGCGTGRDVYLLSQMVGEHGEVVGVDMTDEQLATAKKHIDFHRNAFGYSKSNVRFMKGYLEQLDELNLADNSFDVIVSNCVINLAVDKRAVLAHAARLLRDGGEMYFSDVYADKRIEDELRQDPVLYGECLSGALYFNDFVTLAKDVGFSDPRLVEYAPIELHDPDVQRKIGHVAFSSATYRLFNIPSLEGSAEDYGQAVVYKNEIPATGRTFVLDAEQHFELGKTYTVCGNTFRMLQESRFASFFDFIGDFSTHFGPFKGPATHTSQAEQIATDTLITPTLGASAGQSQANSCC